MSTYYKITDENLIGRQDSMFECYIYDAKKGWKRDTDNILMDRIIGYDETEKSGSPYGIGNSDIMSRIKKITEEEANILIANM